MPSTNRELQGCLCLKTSRNSLEINYFTVFPKLVIRSKLFQVVYSTGGRALFNSARALILLIKASHYCSAYLYTLMRHNLRGWIIYQTLDGRIISECTKGGHFAGTARRNKSDYYTPLIGYYPLTVFAKHFTKAATTTRTLTLIDLVIVIRLGYLLMGLNYRRNGDREWLPVLLNPGLLVTCYCLWWDYMIVGSLTLTITSHSLLPRRVQLFVIVVWLLLLLLLLLVSVQRGLSLS